MVDAMGKRRKLFTYIGSAAAEVAVPSQLIVRARPRFLYPLSQVMASLVDELDLLFPDEAVTISDPRILGQTKSRTVTINLVGCFPGYVSINR